MINIFILYCFKFERNNKSICSENNSKRSVLQIIITNWEYKIKFKFIGKNVK